MCRRHRHRSSAKQTVSPRSLPTRAFKLQQDFIQLVSLAFLKKDRAGVMRYLFSPSLRLSPRFTGREDIIGATSFGDFS